jgi:hypothetical protein
MNLTEFAHLFNLAEMEKQAYILNKVRGISLILIINNWMAIDHYNIATFEVGIKIKKR